MKIQFRHGLFALALLALSTLNAQLSTAHAQGTAFTYQGQLQNNGSPASGTYNLTFSLFTVPSGGSAVAGPVVTNGVNVSNGLFTVTMDFGSGVFTGTNYWLEIGVETNGATPFATLAPRQQLTPTPYAIFAETASNLSGTLPAAQIAGTVATATTANNFSGSLAGDVTGTQGATVVSKVGGVTAANVASGANAANAATSASTPNTIVKRDGTGNFSAGIITASLNGNAATASSYGGTLPIAQLTPAGAVVTNNEPSVTLSNLSLTGSLTLPTSNSGSNGVIFVGGTPVFSAQGNAGNIFVGPSAGNLTGNAGGNNTALGHLALNKINGSASENVAVGESALAGDTSGANNTAAGYNALANISTGTQNTAVGNGAITGGNASDNTAIGYHALSSGTGGNNTASGANALGNNLGSHNTANGVSALQSLSGASSSYDTAVGDSALFNENNGGRNTAVGAQALLNITTGTNDIALGFNAGTNLTIGSSNIYIGSLGGATNENNTIRIGTPGIHTNTFIAGFITGNGGGLTNLNVTVSGVSSNDVAIGAGLSNSIAGGANYGFIGGGVSNSIIGGNYAFIGGGDSNTVNGSEATIAGGTSNTVLSADGTIGGGLGNQIQSGGNYAFIGGGSNNTVNGSGATIAGGTGNLAAEGATVSGGVANSAELFSSVGGGQGNSTVSGIYFGFETIGGGFSNTVSGLFGTVGGGQGNQVGNFSPFLGSWATVSGGVSNSVIGNVATVGGGSQNTASGDGSFIGGGGGNTASGNSATVGGGNANFAGGTGSFIGGGGYDGTTLLGNTNAGNAAAIVGGVGNQIQSGANYAFIGGGYFNTNSGQYATIGGGFFNINSGQSATIGGGGMNTAGSAAATVGGGLLNGALGIDATVAGGELNFASGVGSFVGGGGYDGTTFNGNTNSGNAAAIVGGLGNQIQSGANYGFIGGGVSNNIAGGNYATIGGGAQNTANGYSAVVPGGFGNTASGSASFAAGDLASAIHHNTFVWSDGSAAFTSTAPNQFLILATNGVGIGTASPETALHVAGPSGAAVRVTGPGGGGTSVSYDLSTYDPGTNAPSAQILAADDGAWGNYLSFSTKTDGAETNALVSRLTIFPNGHVGMGSAALSDSGHLLAVGSIVNPAYCDGNMWVAGSDRNSKSDFADINAREVLEKVSAMPVTQWRYKTEPEGVKHVGPMAQDFHAAFGLNGQDDTHISVVDEGGVALAAIQGLDQKVETENAALRAENADLKARLAKLEQIILNQKPN